MLGLRFRRTAARVAVIALAAVTPVALAAPGASAASPDLVISQVYGGGGNSGATYTHDYIELFNRGTTAVSLSGMSIQYASATGTGNFGGSASQLTALPNVTLEPGQYYLVQQASNAAVGAPLPTPDLVAGSPIAMAVGAGKVALATGATSLGCNGGSTPCSADQLGRIVDLVGYGNANFFEGASAAPTLSATTAALRAGGGCTDTDNNGADFTADAPAPRNTATTSVVCSTEPPVDDAPTVASVSPSNGGTGTPSGPITVTFSEPVNVADGAFSLTCSISGGVTLGVTGGPTAFTLTPTAPLADGDECLLSVSAAGVTDVDTNDPPDTMAEDFTSTFTVADACKAEATPVPAIQGSGETSPLQGQTVTTRGIVVGDYEGPTPNLRGFYLQDPVGDADPATSDGIFVFNGGNQNVVSIGDLVTVTGLAGENQGQTQISTSAAQITVCDTGATIAPTEVTLPLTSASDLERYEGMLVTMPQTLYVTEHFQLGRFGQVVVSSGDRLRQPTNVVAPGAPAVALQAQNNLNRLIIDDGLNGQNPDPIVFGRGGQPLSASNTLRGGDTITDATGVMTFTWAGNAASGNAYRLRPVNALGGSYNFEVGNPRPAAPAEVGGDVTAATLNLLNYFNTFSGCTGGVSGMAMDCRGANNATEFNRQWRKTVAAILKIDADVLGVNEIENDGYGPTSAIADLVDRLNAETAPGTYAFMDVDAATGQLNALGTDAIKVGMIYKPGSVTPIGQTGALNTTSFVTGGDPAPRNRPALAQAFEVNATGGAFVVTANHLKSKGSACTVPDAGDGQGNCNQVRLNAAQELASWLAADPTGTGEKDILILGDLNSYAKEDPITALKNAGYTNLIEHFLGEDAYSYVFDGQWGYLDHALGSADLFGKGQVTSVSEYHINADEPSVLDYNTEFKTAGLVQSLYAPDEFRVSDHDPVIVGLAPNSPATIDASFGEGFLQCGADNATLTVDIADRDAADTHTVTVDWGDGSETTVVGTDEDSVTLTHTYAAVGTYTATVTVMDSHGHLTPTTAEATVAYDTTGLNPPFKKGSVTVKNGATVPLRIDFQDCDGLEPTDLDPTVSVSRDGQEVLSGTMAYVNGQWEFQLRTAELTGPATYALTITVPETGQTVTATVVVRR
jgi:uncharacterized protein